MQFTKMHGAGNDYVYVDTFAQPVDNPAGLARRIADRHFGVGGDGLVLIAPSECADVRMRMFNIDGSESEMCGNAIRCVGKYAYDRKISRNNPLTVETLAGVKTLQLRLGDDGLVRAAEVDMGPPILEPSRIPVDVADDRAIDVPLRTPVGEFRMTCVSMGNPHAVIYVDDLAKVDLAAWGPAVEAHPLFPRRVNAHFVQVHNPGEVTVVHWERGSGPTLACGTGASAVCVAGALTGRSDREITAHLPGGELVLAWCQSDNHVYMTGPAVEVFRGEYLEPDV